MLDKGKVVSKIAVILEDCHAAFELTRIAIANLSIPVRIMHFWNGERGLAYLREANLLEISLLIIDLREFPMSTFQFLGILKADAELRRIPAIVYCIFDSQKYRQRLLNAGADAVIVKPFSYEQHEYRINQIFTTFANPSNSTL